MRKPVTICISLSLLLTLAVSSPGITHCHDYVYYTITGNNWNSLSVAQLRDTLTKMGYKLVNPTTSQTPNESAQLKRHDIVIFGDAHSGAVVDDQGHINHFLQSTKLAEQGQPYSLDTFRSILDSNTNEPLFKRKWTVQQIREVEHRVVRGDGTVFVLTPYKDVKMEIWRHPMAGSLPKTNRFWD